MRGVVALCALLACAVAAGPAVAGECPGNPDAIGTSRTIVVDPAEHSRVGSFQYPETLPLADKEVVITFDDGPLPPYSHRVLDILAHECVKATFFMIGRMAQTYPRTVRRVYEEGHSLASHSQNHLYNFHTMSVLDAAWEIETGFESITAAVGDPAKVSPFFRFPGLHRQDLVEKYLASKGRMSWSVDFMGDDWMRFSARDIVHRVLTRLEAHGKGILLLHDIKPTTAVALPVLLHELKARGYHMVHVVAATPDRPKTPTVAADWHVAHPPTERELASREPSMWPRAARYRIDEPETTIRAPSLRSFGAREASMGVPVELVATPDSVHNGQGVIHWPDGVATAALKGSQILPIPAATTFRYHSLSRARAKRQRHDKSQTVHSSNQSPPGPDVTGSILRHSAAKTAPKKSKARTQHMADRPIDRVLAGHQLLLPNPAAKLAPRN
jgi:peptidoglycan/xylan/chitin deacetylase (PgdA/CDA1 family)